MSPVTGPGRVIVLLTVAAVLLTVPAMSNRLVSMMTSKSTYTRAVYRTHRDISHVVVCGNLNGYDAGRHMHVVAVARVA